MERSKLVNSIQVAHRAREDFLSPEVSMVLRLRAICRRLCDGDKEKADELYPTLAVDAEDDVSRSLVPMIQSRDMLHHARMQHEKVLVKLAKQLHVWAWWEAIPGVGALGLGQIIGSAGDLANYATIMRLWKRMGLGLVNGERQRRVKGPAAKIHGYSPERRSTMFSIGEAAIKHQGPYRDVYLARKDYERERAEEEGLAVRPAAEITDENQAGSMSVGHVHNRARRYMEKQMLRDLWREWRAG